MIKIGNADISAIYLGNDAVSKIYLGSVEVYSASSGSPIDYSTEYFTLSALESGTFTWGTTDVEYSLNDGAWTTWDDVNGLSVSSGDKVRFRSSTNTSYNAKTITATGNFDVEGNSMSLLYGDNFENQTTLPMVSYTFYKLFSGCTKLINAENLILPAVALRERSYCNMFTGCSNLIAGPAILPATTLSYYSYLEMFRGCSSLTKAPKFLVTSTGAQQAFNGTFRECTSLVNPPELSLTGLGQGEFVFCFQDCTSLTTSIPLPATGLTSACYQHMYDGCTSLVNVPATLPATTLMSQSYQYMFRGCSSLVQAPELPAPTLSTQSYDYMFSGCTSLNYVKCLATDITASNCTRKWLQGVSATGTFVKDATMTAWTTGVNGIPDNWTVISI